MVTQGGSEQVGIQSGLCFRKITRAMACRMRTPRLNSMCEASVKDGTEEGLTGSPAVTERTEGTERVPPTSSASAVGSPPAASPCPRFLPALYK